MKNKEKLLLFLAFNAITPFVNAETRYDKIYNKMVKNLTERKSNESSYNLLTRILVQRNKELKDLYMQGDYIIKPEYLEWQVFFSGLYSNVKRGDDTLKNAKYYSMPKTSMGTNTIEDNLYNSIINSGVSDDTLQMILNGNTDAYKNLTEEQKAILTGIFGGSGVNGNFKPFQNQGNKIIDLGISMKINGPTKNVSDVNILRVNVPTIDLNQQVFAEPDALNVPEIEILSFNPSIPNITTLNFNSIPVLTLNGKGGGNGGITGFFPYGDSNGSNSIISQMDITSGTISVRTNVSTQSGASPTNPGFYDYTLDNVTGTPSVGLEYYQIGTYDPVTNTWTYGDALLPTGIYTDSINNNPMGYGSEVQGLFKVIDNPITRYGTVGGNINDLKVILEGDVANADYLVQILHYDEHYMGMYDPVTGEWKNYTLDELEERNWITSAEKAELGNKFLDTTLGHTTGNRWFQYVENNSSWNLKGSNVVAVNLQAHSGYQEANSIFMNRGEIIGLNEASSTNNLIGKQVAFMFTEGGSYRKQEGFDNTGLIEMRAPESVLFLMTNNAYSYDYNESNDNNGNHQIYDSLGKHILMNNGDMKLYGNNNIGVYTHNTPVMYKYESTYYYLDGTWYESKSITNGLQRTEIRLYNPITVLGDQSIGVDIETELNFANSKIKIDVGTEDPRQSAASSAGVNGLENSGNTAGGNSAYTDSAVGIYTNMKNNVISYSKYVFDQINPANNISINEYKVDNPRFTLSDYLLNIGEYSRGGVALRVEDYGDIILGNSSDTTTNHEINLLEGSEGNAGIYLRGSNLSTQTVEVYPGYTETAEVLGFIGARAATDGMLMNIAGNKQVGVQIEDYGYFYHKNGNIKIKGTNNTGIAVRAGGTGEISNTGALEVSAGNLGVYNENIFNMTGGSITASGTEAVGIYSEINNTATNLSGGTVKAEYGGIGLYAGANSTINLAEGVNLVAGNKGLLFYNYDGGLASGKYSVTGNVNATIEEGGIAFYLKYGTNLENYLNASFTGISGGRLGLTMKSGSILYMLEGTGSTLSLTTLDGMVTPVMNLANNVSINTDSDVDYIPISMNKGALILDRDINMNGSDLYEKARFALLSVTLNNGKTMTGSLDKQTGIAQRNYGGSSGRDEITLTNNGTIVFNGGKAVGIAADYGRIINNNVIKTVGNESVGIYSANGSLTENNGEILIAGNNTAGIYGVNYLDGVTTSAGLGYGDDKINITNNGKITASGPGKVYGIYAANRTGIQGDNIITLNSGSDINLQNSSGGIGIYVNNGTISGTGTLSIGSDSIGIYAKDSTVNFSGLTLNMTGNNMLGFYLDGNTNFSGSGNINISGNNIAVFNILSSGTFNQNFNISSTADSTYTIGNIKNGTFHYNGTANLAGNGSLINGKDSAVLLDTGSTLLSTDEDSIGAILEGQYNSTLPAGFTAGIDAENRGTIAFENSSAGLYGSNGTRLKNIGSISLGDSSMGLHTNGSGSYALNDGSIALGSLSVGIYGQNSSNLENLSNGVITGSGRETIGIYAEGSAPLVITNDGRIELNGDKSIGIYSKADGGTSVTNNGTIITGDSSDDNNPGVGIYSGNSADTIVNNGIVSAGRASVGIYINGGILNQNNSVNIGNNGTGIYAAGGTVNLNAGSSLNVSNDQSVGVYALNGTNILNDSTTALGNNSFGYVLRTGSALINNANVTAGDGSIVVFGDGAGNITNNGAVTLGGSNGAVFYTVNGGNIQNTGDITGTAGTANVGIYNENGIINNTGKIHVGNSVIRDFEDSSKNSYAMGIYGDRTGITNTGDIEVGYYGVGIYSKDNKESGLQTVNSGKITSSSEGAIGILIENGVLKNTGDIELSGNNSIGIYANKSAEINNTGTIIMNGNDSTAIYMNILSKLNNTGTIYINGNDSEGIIMKGASEILNQGTINIGAGTIGSVMVSEGEASYPVPSIVNAGVINVYENFELKGIDISIKVNPDTVSEATVSEDIGAAFVSDAVKFNAPSFNTTEPIGILGGFAEGTHAEVYKFKDVFNPMTTDGGPDTGLVKVRSKSLTWSATPVLNERGNVDIWMQKIPYDNFTSGLWYQDFGLALDTKYTGSKGSMGRIFDKIDLIETEMDFRKTMSSLAGDVYSNMNQREETIADIFEDSLGILQNSKNNTKENVKVNIIAGKGKLQEETEGVQGFDYTSAGVQLLREVERTYKHTFGYSAGYLHTGFEFADGNESEEKADTLQLGLHNKYSTDNWVLKNDLTGRVSFHNMERNINWTHSGRSEMTAKYESYSLTSNNILGKELELGKRASIMPYGGVKATYGIRPTFSEKGLEALEVDKNDAWSIKPRVGVELKGEYPLNSKESWKLKGMLDLSYEYELADFNEREYARLTAVEDKYHKLAKPEAEKGAFKTKATLGVEIEDRYGVFLTGEYKTGNVGKDDYRAGINLKAVF
ncbi:MAG: autotransporter domain-containing protein [Fusobacteriales bacterium]|jgi:hypothetical protein|nr:autotransporter domain-containing protein [Fusobacteriales bacterium]